MLFKCIHNIRKNASNDNINAMHLNAFSLNYERS